MPGKLKNRLYNEYIIKQKQITNINTQEEHYFFLQLHKIQTILQSFQQSIFWMSCVISNYLLIIAGLQKVTKIVCC